MTRSRRLTQAPQAGDVVGGGYGEIDLANFDPATVTYTGTDADGYFWYHTEATGLDSVLLAIVQEGTVLNSKTVSLDKAADVFSILEADLNWYAVGPARWKQTYTDVAGHPQDPQRNEFIGAVANDDGKGPGRGSQRLTVSIHQAAGNSGLGVEAGSLGTRASGEPNFQFKTKGHQMTLENTNTTDETYQVLGAIRPTPGRESVKMRVVALEITNTPGTEVTNTEVLLVAVDSSETNAPAATSFETPVEHNPSNSIVETVEVAGDAATPLTGPDQEGAGTDVTGPDTSNTVTNPGGYQMGRETVDVEGTGSKTASKTGQQVGNRELYDTDIALVLVDSDTAGTIKLQVQTEQNS